MKLKVAFLKTLCYIYIIKLKTKGNPMSEEVISYIQDWMKQTSNNPKNLNLMKLISETATELDKEYRTKNINIQFNCESKDYPHLEKTVVFKIIP